MGASVPTQAEELKPLGSFLRIYGHISFLIVGASVPTQA